MFVRSGCILLAAVLLAGVPLVTPAGARKAADPRNDFRPVDPISAPRSLDGIARPLYTTAPAETTILGSWTFDGTGCTNQGWTTADLTVEAGQFFHVENFVGLNNGDFGRLFALEGNQSLWCGVRPGASQYPGCTYAAPPGYGNNWNQMYGTVNCLSVAGDLGIVFKATWDSEPAYDGWRLEYDACDDDWRYWPGTCQGGGCTDGIAVDSLVQHVLPDSLTTASMRLRFRFASDGAWSDEDGLWDTDGALVIDSLSLYDATGLVLPVERFEAEAVGESATVSGNWAPIEPDREAFGIYAGLFTGAGVLQEDPCHSNISCVWGFFSGSTSTYQCGGHPEQAAVPYGNSDRGWLHNGIISPPIPITGSGASIEIELDVYRDLSVDGMVFWEWFVRPTAGVSCAGEWIGPEYNLFYGSQKDWARMTFEAGALIDPAAIEIQLMLTCFDACWIWYCFNEECHSHAPLFDNVVVRRVNPEGPQWSVDALHLFQDGFSEDGTLTGTMRADIALDTNPVAHPNIYPGDSTVVKVSDLDDPVAVDSHTGTGPAVYCYVRVDPPQPGKDGPALAGDPFRYPLVDSLQHGGDTWYCLRMDTSFVNGNTRTEPQLNEFCVDLNDNLFTPGDVVWFAFSAKNTSGEATWWSEFTGTTTDMAEALAQPMEFTCLPVHGLSYGYSMAAAYVEPNDGPVLYVDVMDGRGAQPYFEEAFAELGIDNVDRYDVRSPTSGLGNGLASRVKNVQQQIVAAYQFIVWNTGDLEANVGLGDGTTYYEKEDDAALLYEFLHTSPDATGLYLSGDNLADRIYNKIYPGAGLVALRSTYITGAVAGGDNDHVAAGYSLSPTLHGEPGTCFDHVNDLVAYGGCPSINAFDVITPQQTARLEMTYDGSGPGKGSVISQSTSNPQGADAQVLLSGFSFHEVRDAGPPQSMTAHARHLDDVMRCFGWAPPYTAADNPSLRTTLSQNYPNPFNPTTTIEFTLRERGPVRIDIFNVAGQRVRSLLNEARAPGVIHEVEWNGRSDAGQSVASGVYFYRLVTADATMTRKMVLLK